MSTAVLDAPEIVPVAKGAEFLDQTLPGWQKKVDLDKLDESSAVNCVLAQVLGTPWGNLAMRYEDYDKFAAWSDELGFSAPYADYAKFTAAWRVEILARA